jgi:hypothetical protein
MTQELALRRASSKDINCSGGGRRDEGDQVDIQLCTAGKACEIACAVEHCASEESSGAVFERPAPQKMVHVEPAHASPYPMHCSALRRCSVHLCVSERSHEQGLGLGRSGRERGSMSGLLHVCGGVPPRRHLGASHQASGGQVR